MGDKENKIYEEGSDTDTTKTLIPTWACTDNDLVPLKKLPCGHKFHASCIDTWLNKHCTCPICRYELPTNDAMYEIGRKERMELRRKKDIGNNNADDAEKNACSISDNDNELDLTVAETEDDLSESTHYNDDDNNNVTFRDSDIFWR